MYIACPKCSTKFKVTSEQIGKDGRNVKCSQCLHIWHQNIAAEVADNQIQNNQIKEDSILTTDKSVIDYTSASGVNLPALLPVAEPYFCPYFTPMLLISLIVFMLAILLPDKLGSDFLLKTICLDVKDLQVKSDEELNKIIVTYQVHNASLKTVQMPFARVRLLDKNGKIINSLVNDYRSINMVPGQFIQVKMELDIPDEAAESINIMLGNKLDMIVY